MAVLMGLLITPGIHLKENCWKSQMKTASRSGYDVIKCRANDSFGDTYHVTARWGCNCQYFHLCHL